jgi:hypothetical protein
MIFSEKSNIEDPDPGSGIWFLFDPWIRDQGRVKSKDPGSGIWDGKKSDPGEKQQSR